MTLTCSSMDYEGQEAQEGRLALRPVCQAGPGRGTGQSRLKGKDQVDVSIMK